MSELGIGLIGCGRIAQAVHLPVLKQIAGARVVAFADPDPQRRSEALAKVPAAKAYADYRELLQSAEVSAAIVCLPTHMHAEAGIAVLEREKALYLEKPIALDLEQAELVLQAAERSRSVAMLGFNYRSHPLFQAAKSRILSGAIGETVAVQSVFSSGSRTLPEWKTRRATGGGVLLDLASHHIDLVHFLFDQRITKVYASVRSQRAEGDSALLHMHLTDGVVVQTFVSLSSVEEDRFDVYGQNGRLVIDRFSSVDLETATLGRSHWQRIWGRVRPMLSNKHVLTKLRYPGHDPSFAAALSEFVRRAAAGLPAEPSLLDGYQSLAVVIAAERSAREGVPVKVGSAAYARSAN